jgi:hypothetical protein
MGIYDDLDDRGSQADFLERCHRDFVATGNPLYAWEAWGTVYAAWRSRPHEAIPLPEWLGEYLDDCGRRLVGVPMDVVDRKVLGRFAGSGIRFEWVEVEERPAVAAETGEGPGFIGCALGFSEGLAKAREHWGGPFDYRENLALRVVDLMWSERLSLDAAAFEAEARGWAKHRTAGRAVERARGGALRRMQDWLREKTGRVPRQPEVVRAYSRLCKTRNT